MKLDKKEYMKIYREENKDKIKEYARQKTQRYNQLIDDINGGKLQSIDFLKVPLILIHKVNRDRVPDRFLFMYDEQTNVRLSNGRKEHHKNKIKNKDSEKVRHKEYYKKNLIKEIARSRKYYEENKEKIKEYNILNKDKKNKQRNERNAQKRLKAQNESI